MRHTVMIDEQSYLLQSLYLKICYWTLTFRRVT